MIQDVQKVFLNSGGTDFLYFKSHYNRFLETYNFASKNLSKESNILDVGCHWLHQLYFFSSNEYKNLIGVDNKATLKLPSVKNFANIHNIRLIEANRLDDGLALNVLPDDSVDLLLFCEILEHLSFNPLDLWKQIYRVLKNNGKIILTTPNSLYYKSVENYFKNITASSFVGIDIKSIFDSGTYGHHWKEYSLPEIKKYFETLSSEFIVNDYEVLTFCKNKLDEKDDFFKNLNNNNFYNIKKIIEDLDNNNCYPYGQQIIMEIILQKNGVGVQKNPPWRIE